MSRKPAKSAKPAKDYPLVTHGGQAAARGRRKAIKMTDAQREHYFRRGMVLIQEARTQKRLSLDTNVLFDLADGKDFAHV